MRIYNLKRSAMTLVELLVVMAIIIIFTAITAAFYPANHADRELSRFSNTVQSSLLSARNRARTERLPTGIRFFADTAIVPKVFSVVMIQKPAPLDGSLVGALTVNPMTNLITFPGNYIGAIKGGDFIVLESGDVGGVGNVPPNTNTLTCNPSNTTSSFYTNLTSYPTKYKIFRSPMELSGDKPFEISDTIEILMPGASFSTASDIIFNPDGSLQNSNDNIYLHLHNFEAKAGDYSRDAILVVRKMTGSIGVFEVGPVDFTGNTPHNPYLFAKDPRNKGI